MHSLMVMAMGHWCMTLHLTQPASPTNPKNANNYGQYSNQQNIRHWLMVLSPNMKMQLNKGEMILLMMLKLKKGDQNGNYWL